MDTNFTSKSSFGTPNKGKELFGEEVGGVGINCRALACQGLHLLMEERENQSG